jgi:hypothetical protein
LGGDQTCGKLTCDRGGIGIVGIISIVDHAKDRQDQISVAEELYSLYQGTWLAVTNNYANQLTV